MKLRLTDLQRLSGWRTAVVALRAHPWRWPFGWGPETFPLVYRLHRDAAATSLIGPTHIADHAHNLPLELLVTLGGAGTAAVAWLLWSLWRDADDVGQAALLGLLLMSLVEPVPVQGWALLFLLLGTHWTGGGLAKRVTGAFRLAAGTCLVIASLVWVSDYCAYAGKESINRGDWAHAAAWGRTAIRLNPTSVHAIEVAVMTGQDAFSNVQAFHPHDADANQLAVIEMLNHGDAKGAQFFAHRVIAEDPQDWRLVEQSNVLDAYVARRAR